MADQIGTNYRHLINDTMGPYGQGNRDVEPDFDTRKPYVRQENSSVSNAAHRHPENL